MAMWLLRSFILSILVLVNPVYADFLPPNQAFQFQAVSLSNDQAELTWKIAEGYYLYYDQFKVSQDQKPLKLALPKAKDKDDPNFGMTQVFYHQVKTNIAVKPHQTLQIQWQGCAESGLCYPVQRTIIETDADGLLPQQNLTKTAQQPLISLTDQTSAKAPTSIFTEQAEKNNNLGLKDEKLEDVRNTDNTFEAKALTEQPTSRIQQQVYANSENTTSNVNASQQLQQEWNNDQFFFNLLSAQNLFLNLVVFLGLGILLAFLPCSLPLIPILSTIIVQRKTGYRAALVAGCFVVGMALVYAVIGFAVSQLGYNFQRWFQSPIFISIFAILFVLFALNLFGVFQLSLPQGLLHQLDHLQQRQKGGTLLGALVMGMIAALIVGPCMSAPLAGALLFVAQLNIPILAASYLFILGIGIGLPLFIAAVFGSQYLPKPGHWMDRLKFSFGFVMLALAIYFIRPFMSSSLYFMLMGMCLWALAIYILWMIFAKAQALSGKILSLLLSILILIGGSWQFMQVWQMQSSEHVVQRLEWIQVTAATELAQVLEQHQNQDVLIDVYADWCVACQPIEREVLPRSDVQNALQSLVRIKLDLTQYHSSQDELLKQWQILGPPTMIFLNQNHQEQRKLRLTGTFTAKQLIQHLAELKQGTINHDFK